MRTLFERMSETQRYPPEAPWVTDMRKHFAETGHYRPADLERLLGKPGESVAIDQHGRAYLKPPP